MASPVDFLFKLGDWATKGDPKKQFEFTYYMLWILFLSFFGLFSLNLYRFITTIDPMFLVWASIGFAITSLQYFNLKNMYEMRKIQNKPKVEEKIESVEEMLKLFSEEKGEENMKGGIQNV